MNQEEANSYLEIEEAKNKLRRSMSDEDAHVLFARARQAGIEAELKMLQKGLPGTHWASYERCAFCGAEPGKPCTHVIWGEVIANPHKSRSKRNH